jgi:hypothetical protein
LDGDEQHDEAHLLAASVLKGVAGIDGAMVELLTVVHRKERKEKGGDGGGAMGGVGRR